MPANDGASDSRTTTVGAVLGVFGFFGVVAILFYVWRMKPRPPSRDGCAENGGYVFTGFGNGKQEYYQGAKIQVSHPAAQVTPFAFGPNGEGPVFDHEPGTNMRIATRRSDGIWAFHDVDPHTGSPAGINDPVPSPTPITPAPFSSASSTYSFEPRGYGTRSEASSIRTKRSIGNYLEFGPMPTNPPPPAYGPDSPTTYLARQPSSGARTFLSSSGSSAGHTSTL